MRAKILAAMAALTTLFTLGVAAAQTGEGFVDRPADGSIFLREPASPMAEEIHLFHNAVIFPVMFIISLLVLLLLIWVMLRYNSKANPVPDKFSHNTMVEVVWTLVPVLILIYIAMFSFDLLYMEDKMPDAQVYEYEAGITAATLPNDFTESRRVNSNAHLEVMLVDQTSGEETMLSADDYEVEGFGEPEMYIQLAQAVPQGSRLKVIAGRSRVGRKPFLGLFGEDSSRLVPAPSVTIKATGYQWGWTYNYPDFGDFEFNAVIARQDEVPSDLFRLATRDPAYPNEYVPADVVVPAGETIRIITTGRDVIHSWAMPAFGTKIDAVPGRLNETWFYTEQEGTYYGQCSEICGIDHAFMPISVRVVSRDEFEDWVNGKAEENGLEPYFTNEQLAAAAPAEALN